MDSVVVVDKPAGWTSHDVVAKYRNKLKKEYGQKIKVGHAGTLDPMATGLLILLTGKYTKKAGDYSKLDKVYEAEITLGAISSTGDAEGKITVKSDMEPVRQEVETVLSQFLGEIEQIPHKFSAVKVGGKRAYKLAREGKDVEIKPRKVTIYSLNLIDYTYPKLKVTTEVSSGTYIRTLAEDIGEKLGSGAYLSALRRTKIGDFDLSKAVKVV